MICGWLVTRLPYSILQVLFMQLKFLFVLNATRGEREREKAFDLVL